MYVHDTDLIQIHYTYTNTLCSNLVHKFVVCVAQNGKLIAQFENCMYNICILYVTLQNQVIYFKIAVEVLVGFQPIISKLSMFKKLYKQVKGKISLHFK